MDSIDVELKVLIECLKKKEKALKQIAAITENQGFVLTSNIPHEELYPFFMQMNVEKNEFIQLVIQCDEVFENVLKKIGPTLDAETDKHEEEVLAMQELIRVVMDLDVQIRVGEDKNYNILTETLDRIEIPVKEKEKKEQLDSGEYGSTKAIEAYKNQTKR